MLFLDILRAPRNVFPWKPAIFLIEIDFYAEPSFLVDNHGCFVIRKDGLVP